MSLETVIAENTAALQQQTAAIERLLATMAKAPDPERGGAPAPAASKAKAEKPATKPETPKAEAKAEGIAYETVANAITAVAKNKGRDAALTVLAKFGVKNGKELKPEQFADVLAACDAV